MKTVTLSIGELNGQAAGRDIHNRGPVACIESISGGINLVGHQGEIHFHLTLPSAEIVASLIDLLKQASTAKRAPTG